MLNKNRKPINPPKNPLLRNCLYIIVPVALLVAFKFISVGANWLFDTVLKAGWPILITFVLTSLGWAIFYGLKEQKKSNTDDEDKESDEDDEEDEDELI